MDPLIRSRLREELKEVAEAHRWADLLRQYGTPLLVLDPTRAAAQYRILQAQLPGVELHYAVKTMPHPAVINAVADCGGSFDVASAGEVDHVRSLGVSMSRCIYTHPVKKPRDIAHAYRAGIRRFVVDSPGEAHKFRGLPADIEVMVRLAFGNPGAKSDLSVKFGIDAGEAEQVVKEVVATGVRFVGFSFHVGSQSASVDPFRTALSTTLALIDQVEAAVGVRVRVLDIGGGFPVTYRDPMPAIAEVCAAVREILGPGPGRFSVLAEPGRFVAASCGTLLTSVVGTAVRGGATWHYLDDGLYGSYSNILTEDVHPPLLSWSEIADAAAVAEPVVLAGPTCDSVDVIARHYPMPVLRGGDVVVSPMMGAYTTVTASGFNGIEPTPVVVV